MLPLKYQGAARWSASEEVGQTLTFETEDEAKNFARTKFNEGLIVTAGTIIPHLPRRAFASDRIPSWLEEGQHADPNEQETSEQDKTGGSQP